MKGTCIECGKNLRGRSDKKYCDIHCKNAYHNQQNQGLRKQLGTINSQLLSNFRILRRLIEANERKIHRDRLLLEGYHLERSTEIHKLKDHPVVYFCFDLGIKPLENDYFAITTKD